MGIDEVISVRPGGQAATSKWLFQSSDGAIEVQIRR